MPTSYRDVLLFRICATCLAAVLGLQATWLLAAELMRPVIPFFPATAEEAGNASKSELSAKLAARLGWPRGAGWNDYAVTASADAIAMVEEGVMSIRGQPKEDSLYAAEKTAKLSPADARAWLLLALDSVRMGADERTALSRMKMSYYTAPYSDDLFPLRIQVVARLASINDEELSSDVKYELSVVAKENPNLKPCIALAYRVPSPAVRKFLDTTLDKQDPNFLKALKARKN